MIFRALDGNHDWTFGRGLSNYLTGEAAIDANIQTRLLSWVGGCFFALTDGIDWKSRLDVGQQTELVDELKTNILQAFGVVGVISVVPVFDGVTRLMTITYNIQTIYSQSFQNQIELSAGGLVNA